MCWLLGCARPWPSQRQRSELWFTVDWGCREALRSRPMPSMLTRSCAVSTGSPSSYGNFENDRTIFSWSKYLNFNWLIQKMLHETVNQCLECFITSLSTHTPSSVLTKGLCYTVAFFVVTFILTHWHNLADNRKWLSCLSIQRKYSMEKTKKSCLIINKNV